MKYLSCSLAFSLLMLCPLPTLADSPNATLPYAKQGSQCDTPILKNNTSAENLAGSSQIAGITDAETLFQKTQSAKSDDFLIVDTRPAFEFSSYAIKDSINLSASTIQTKAYWKDKEIYLVGGDKFDLPLLVIRKRLDEQGFKKVKVVAGGINTWVNKRMPVIGKAPNANRLIQLSPADVWTSRQDMTTLYVLDTDFAKFAGNFAHSVVIHDLETKNPAQAIMDYQKSHKLAMISKVYFLTSSININNTVVSAFNQEQRYASFLFNAKPEFLGEYIDSFDRLLVAKENGPKKPKCG